MPTEKKVIEWGNSKTTDPFPLIPTTYSFGTRTTPFQCFYSFFSRLKKLLISGAIGSAWFDGQLRCHKWFWLGLLGCRRPGIEIQRQIRNNKQIQKSIFNLGFLLQVTVTADGLQARYVDKTKLDLPAITASARYRWRICLEAFFVLFPFRSYLNIAQYEEVDSDDESVANKFTRWVKS